MDALVSVLSDWPHLLLLGGATLGGVLVGIGILKESKEWGTGPILVLIGVIIEPIFTLGLFVYDESISRAQKAEIARLEVANTQLEAQIQPRRLTPEQQKAISNGLAPFSGHNVTVRSFSFDTDGIILAQQIQNALKPWIPVTNSIGSIVPIGNTSLTQGVSVTGSNSEFISALTTVLRDKGHLVVNNDPPMYGRGTMAFGAISSPSSEALIFVGVKPLPK